MLETPFISALSEVEKKKNAWIPLTDGMGWAQVRIYGIDLELNRQGLLLSLAGKTIKAHGVRLLFNFFLKFRYCEQAAQLKKYLPLPTNLV